MNTDYLLSKLCVELTEAIRAMGGSLTMFRYQSVEKELAAKVMLEMKFPGKTVTANRVIAYVDMEREHTLQQVIVQFMEGLLPSIPKKLPAIVPPSTTPPKIGGSVSSPSIPQIPGRK